MRIAGELTTRLTDGSGSDEAPTSEILLNGKSTSKLVPGAVLEGAVEVGDRYLLFMTDDIPFEEFLHVLLLDDRFDPIDSAKIGGPYSTGSFGSLALREPNTVTFRFIGDTIWSIEVLPSPGLRMPFVSEPAGVSRGFGFSRHFIVRGDPKPQTAS